MTEEKNQVNSNIAYRVLIEPWITEAASLLAQMNKYVFKVAKTASKPEIKKSIEEVYKVTVLNVRVINLPGKKRTRGRIEGKKSGVRKAIVTVKEGDTINIYEGK